MAEPDVVAVCRAVPKGFGALLYAAVEQHPQHCDSARRLVRHLYVTDALEELVYELAPAISGLDIQGQCDHFIGLAAATIGDQELAARYLRNAVSAGYAESRGHLAKLFLAQGKRREAYDLALEALAADPTDDAAGQAVFQILIADRRYAELWQLCAQLCETGWSARMVSAMAVGAEKTHEIAQLRSLVNYDCWLERTTVGWSELEIQALAKALKGMPHWSALPRSKATSGDGERIERLHLQAHHPLLNKFFSDLLSAVRTYLAKRSDLIDVPAANHPMSSLRPHELNFVSWAVCVRLGGYEDWHIHPDGWLSGVYYVDVPESQPGHSSSGPIEFGPYPLGGQVSRKAWPRRKVVPRPGDLLIFPSYIAHRTWPTGSQADRICIAFDILRHGIVKPGAPIASIAPQSLPTGQLLARDPRAVSHTHGNITVVMNVESGDYISLDSSGSTVWQLLGRPHSLQDLANVLSICFDAAMDVILAELQDHVHMMVSRGLIRVYQPEAVQAGEPLTVPHLGGSAEVEPPTL